jgi:hypothetical protein
MRNLIRTGVVGALLGALMWVGGFASSHTPQHHEGCDSVSISGTNYNAQHTNSWSISMGGTVVKSGTFGGTFSASVTPPQDGSTHHWVSQITAWDDPTGSKGWTKTYEANVGPCGTPPPPCDACHMVKKQTAAPEVTICRGVIVNQVLNDVQVRENGNCTLVNVYVNGSVNAEGAYNLTMGGSEVVGNVNADNMTGSLLIGSNDNDCSADPRVGGSVWARHSHNVILCHLQVCHSVVLTHDDGRMMVRDSTGRRLVVRHNDTFVKDGDPQHKALAGIRLFQDHFNYNLLHPNKRHLIRR